MFDLEAYTLESRRDVECVDCDASGQLKSIAKAGTTFAGIQVGKESRESAWQPTGSGWKCPDWALVNRYKATG